MIKRLTPPTVVVFWIALILIVTGMLGYYTNVIDLEVATAFLLTSVGGVLLVLGSLFKGI